MSPETHLDRLLDISMEDTASQKGYYGQEFQIKHETSFRMEVVLTQKKGSIPLLIIWRSLMIKRDTVAQ